ncbi:MAG: signal peptidase I [Phycisphaerales bacterium]|nr:signal peptidase I [Phycisphaerales bacterium]
MQSALVLAQQSSNTAGELIFSVIYLGLVILVIAGFWKTFAKAGEPGWAAIIPIFNTYIMLKIAGRAWWWLVLLIIPIVSLVVWIVASVDIAKSFGKGTGFGIGLALLPFIFYPILGFGDAQYQGPVSR